MMKLLLTMALLLPLAALAEEPEAVDQTAVTACSSDGYRQFDFWIGDWVVMAGEQQAGTNSIHPIHNGCALQENWQGAGAGGISGTSFNIFDRERGLWHQTWVDASGTLLQLDGGLSDGTMVLKGKRPAPGGNGLVLHRISWTPNEDGSVKQLWEASQDNGESWNVIFDGHYTRVDTP